MSGSEAGKGKGRARGYGAKSTPTKQTANRVAVGTDKAEMYQATLMADVCAELARVEVAGPAAVSTKKSGFLFGSLSTTPDDVARISSAGAAASLPERHAADSFRLKLQGLRDALLSRRGSEGNAPVGQSVPSVRTIIGDVAPDDLDIHPQAVKRALERGRCGEAFILAVQVTIFSLSIFVLTCAKHVGLVHPRVAGGWSDSRIRFCRGAQIDDGQRLAIRFFLFVGCKLFAEYCAPIVFIYVRSAVSPRTNRLVLHCKIYCVQSLLWSEVEGKEWE